MRELRHRQDEIPSPRSHDGASLPAQDSSSRSVLMTTTHTVLRTKSPCYRELQTLSLFTLKNPSFVVSTFLLYNLSSKHRVTYLKKQNKTNYMILCFKPLICFPSYAEPNPNSPLLPYGAPLSFLSPSLSLLQLPLVLLAFLFWECHISSHLHLLSSLPSRLTPQLCAWLSPFFFVSLLRSHLLGHNLQWSCPPPSALHSPPTLDISFVTLITAWQFRWYVFEYCLSLLWEYNPWEGRVTPVLFTVAVRSDRNTAQSIINAHLSIKGIEWRNKWTHWQNNTLVKIIFLSGWN